MIYFYLTKIDVAGFEDVGIDGKLPVVINVTTSQGDLGPQNLLMQPELLRESPVDLKVCWVSDDDIPFITFDPTSVDQSLVCRIDDVYNAMYQLYAKAGNTFSNETIRKGVEIISQRYQDAKDRVVVCVRDIRFANSGKTGIDFPIKVDADLLYADTFMITNKLLEQHNQAYTVSDVFTIENNNTLFQNECTDELFIEIPNRAELMVEDPQWKNIIPPSEAISRPYSDINAYSPKYKELGVAKHLLPMIEGNVDNNFLSIQENEKRYYEALIGWVKDGIVKDFGEEIDTIDAVSQEYLTELADRLYADHWSHNPHMPVDIMDDSYDGDGNSSLSESSRYTYRVNEGESTIIQNAILNLNAFLESAATSLGYKVFIEAVIKLARWGSRKPTALAFDGFDKVFDLGSDSVHRNIGPISNYSVKLVNGNQFILKGVITIDKFADNSLNLKAPLPVGLALLKTLADNDGNELKVVTYISMVDVITGLRSGEITIDGLTLEDSSIDRVTLITIGDLLEDYTENTDDFLQDPFYRNEEIFSLAVKFGTGQNHQNLNLMSLLNEAFKLDSLNTEFEKYRLTGAEQLRDKLMKGEIYSSMSAFSVNVTRVMLPVLQKLDDANNSVKDVVKSWEAALDGFDGFGGVWSADTTSTQSATISGTQSTSAQSTKDLAAFAGEATDKPTTITNDIASNIPTVFKQVKTDASFATLVDSEGKQVGGYTRNVSIKNNKKYVEITLVTNDFLTKVAPENIIDKHQSLLKIAPTMISDLRAVVMGSQLGVHVYFTDADCLTYYTNQLRMEIKRIL